MVYCNLDWYKNILLGEKIAEKFDIWLAQWSTIIPSVSCGIWQKSDKGVIDGINGNVDLNIAFKDYSQIMKSSGLNGWTTPTETASTVVSQPAVNSEPQAIEYYTVQKGDSLWKIAEKFLGNGSKYPEIKNLNSLVSDTIYPEQILKIPK
jgi:LysM repeat protein